MTLIAGRYQPLDPGRRGDRVRARDLQTAQTVLLREVRLPPDAAAAAQALARAEATRGIFHPSLVTLFDVVPQPEDRVLLAYEFVPAQSLAQVSGGHPFNARRAVEIVVEVADAAAELHARDLVHGGISASTVLITLKGKAKLDRAGDPTLRMAAEPRPADDIRAMADFLRELVGKPKGGATGIEAIETVVEHVRNGQIETAASLAGRLRRIGQ